MALMQTEAAARAGAITGMVLSPDALIQQGISRGMVLAQCRARRWQRFGTAIVLQNGPLSRDQRWAVARLNCGPRTCFTSFTAAELSGLQGWARSEAHVLVPAGARVRRIENCPVVPHQSRDWPVTTTCGDRHSLEDSVLLAAGSFTSARPACAILAASVQQRLTTVARLRQSLDEYPRIRHRQPLRLALADIAMGAQALSEIDFVLLCRRFGLPAPQQQVVRADSAGRRRYLDASWRRADGTLVVVEVDGALHLDVRQWWTDQARQNELSLRGALVLRFPTVVVRSCPFQVAEQLGRALGLPPATCLRNAPLIA